MSEVQQLRAALAEAQATIRALAAGEVDAAALGPQATPLLLRRAQQDLRASEQRYRLLFECSPLPLLVYDASSLRILGVNAAAVAQYGYSRAEFAQLSIGDLSLPGEPPPHDDLAAPDVAGIAPRPPLSLRQRRKNGTVLDAEIIWHPLDWEEHRARLAVVTDVSERLRAQAALLHMAAMVESTDDAVISQTVTGTILSWNPAAARLYGYSEQEAVGRRLSMLWPVEDVGALPAFCARLARGGSIDHLETTHVRKSGERFQVLMTLSPLRHSGGQITGVVTIVRDISEHVRLEAELRQAQKMEAVGRLAGGVAHDFNNLLTVILGYSELVLKRLAGDRPALAWLNEVHAAARRASALTGQLLGFSRRQVLRPEVMDASGVIAGLETMLRRLIGEDLDFHTSLDPDTGSVLADRGQLELVIMNLVINARDAMPDGGSLTLEAAPVADLEAAKAGLPAAPGWVRMTVTDTGIGMTEEVRQRIFEPFFTTKECGKGTGLGLSAAYGVVTQSGGHLRVSSEPGRGSRFDLYLPRHCAPPPVLAAAPQLEPESTAARCVLVVEDGDVLRALIAQILTDGGYQVLTAPDAFEALEISRRHAAGIDLVITDVVMPGLQGPELAHRLLALHPEAKVLLVSGFAEGQSGAEDGGGLGGHFLQKPFRSDELLQRVHGLLSPLNGDCHAPTPVPPPFTQLPWDVAAKTRPH